MIPEIILQSKYEFKQANLLQLITQYWYCKMILIIANHNTRVRYLYTNLRKKLRMRRVGSGLSEVRGAPSIFLEVKMCISYVTRKQSSAQLLPKRSSRSLRCVADQIFHPVLTPIPTPNLNAAHASKTPICPKRRSYTCHLECIALRITM